MKQRAPRQVGPPAARSAARATAIAAPTLPIVAIGASAGGLDACARLLSSLPPAPGMAFILVQHLDPNHHSMLVDLLASHTSMPVKQATEAMLVERDQVYVIPPGTYLAVENDVLHLSSPEARHGARMPFDFLLRSLAGTSAGRTACVILSGTGTDGSLGLASAKGRFGLVIAQDPDEAAFNGMPRGAIATGAVGQVLPLVEISDALVSFALTVGDQTDRSEPVANNEMPDRLLEIIELLRARTAHDFHLYKHGTLRRRIARRMAMAGIEAGDMAGYLEVLRRDDKESALLANDLLINVTRFFRDADVFLALEESVIPALLGDRGPDLPMRVWVAGCSTGEEAYSIAMLFLEAFSAAKLNIKLQIFASDVDPDAVATAREGLYPATIEDDVSKARLTRFFIQDEGRYRASSELRGCVVFTVQDLLSDPPFARLDMVSCRNLLIYLDPEAQAKAVSMFHFALHKGGVLLLGSSETIGDGDRRFEVISKPLRIYRHIGRPQPGELDTWLSVGGRAPGIPGQRSPPAGAARLAELCRRMVLDAYAPAAVLIDRDQNCLYSLGPTEKYLRMAPGHFSQDLLSMSRHGGRAKLKTALELARERNAPVLVKGFAGTHDGQPLSFDVSIQPVPSDRDGLLLVCFIEQTLHAGRGDRPVAEGDISRIAELEHELAVAQSAASSAIRDLEVMSEEHKAINEEASSVSEEFQSTNEELLTSQEELQSLNEELTALNGQLQETLERQRTTSDDLENVLNSTDIATLFLDAELKIRFFTPSVRRLFNVIPGDVGRPISDLNSLALDSALSADAQLVLRTNEPVEREVETSSGTWFLRHILPYRAHDKVVGGVVMTFTDITERKFIRETVEEARKQADLANVAKSRFLAAASHDLRQPLQTIALLQGLLAKSVVTERSKQLVGRLDEALGAMSGMLNALLDINQIEAGVVQADLSRFPVNDIFERLTSEFSYQAQSQSLEFKLVDCGVVVRTDPRLLEQMLRNLLSNAFKYTTNGRVLLGCRRHPGKLTIEVWDTGVGIAESEQVAIFNEYHQLANAARERSRGLGLGLAIVQRLGDLLGHRVAVRSIPGKGSVFTIEVPLSEVDADRCRPIATKAAATATANHLPSAILLVEDDPEVRELMKLMLEHEGHVVITASDGAVALALAESGMQQPDLILADYNLPGGLSGLQIAGRLRKIFQTPIPVIILTGDISTETLRLTASQDCVQLNKPVNSQELIAKIGELLALSSATPLVKTAVEAPPKTRTMDGPTVYVVDDDRQLRGALRAVLEDAGRTVEDFETAEAFLMAYREKSDAVLLLDAYLPGINGLELLERLKAEGHDLPTIMITGASEVALAVRAMKAGAADFIEKPISGVELIASIDRALERSTNSGVRTAWKDGAIAQLAGLTTRQREIMNLVLAGHPSKNIAADLHISQRTVENHRASIMKKTGSKSIPALARLAQAAA